MGLFSKIKNAIFGRAEAKAAPAATPARPASNSPQPTAAQAQKPAAPAAQAAPQQAVDVEAVLSKLAEQKGGGGNWRTSIVDLLKLLDLDSSLEARKELAEELKVNAGEHGSAEQNIALQKAVMRALAANGGRVPASLQD